MHSLRFICDDKKGWMPVANKKRRQNKQRRRRHFKSGQTTANKRSLVHVERGGRRNDYEKHVHAGQRRACVGHLAHSSRPQSISGADPEVEEGGGAGHRYRVGLVRPCGALRAPDFFRERIMHSVLGRSGGMLLYKFRRYESASEAVGDHHNHAKCLTTGL